MKKVISFFSVLLVISLFTGCGSNDIEEKKEYKGIRLNKGLIESLMNYYPERCNKSYASATICGEYIALNRISEDGAHTDGCVLMNEEGAIITSQINFNPDKIGEFSNGLAAVDNSDYKNRVSDWKLINDEGQVLEINGNKSFQYIGPWVEDNAIIIMNDEVGLINNKGEIVIPIGKYPFLLPIDNGLIITGRGTDRLKFGFVDNSANEIIPFTYDAIDYHDQVLRVKKSSKWGVLDKNGKVVLPIEYDEIGEFKKYGRKNMAKITKAGKHGMINKKGVIIIPCEYEDIIETRWNGEIFFDGFKVKKNGKYGAVDFSGDVVWPIEYDDINIVGAGLADVEKDGRRGVVNHQGKWIEVQARGLIGEAMVYGYLVLDQNNEGKVGAYNENGDIAIPFEYTSVDTKNGFIIVRKDNGLYNVYNFNGEKIADGDFYKIEACGDYVKIKKDYESASTGLYDREGSEIIPLECDNVTMLKYAVKGGNDDEYFFETCNNKEFTLYSKSFNKIHSLEMEKGFVVGYRYAMNRLLNGYYSTIKNNKGGSITLFISNDQEYLFEADGSLDSKIYFPKNYTRERQNEFVEYLIKTICKH